MQGAVAAAVTLVIVGLLVVIVGTSVSPLVRTCSAELDEAACESAVDAVLRRGLPPLHPLILGAHVEPGEAPASSQLGHRATVDLDLLGVPGTMSIALYFDQGAHWGGESDRSDVEVAGWALAPLLLAAVGAVVIVSLAWRRRHRVRG